jgi:uncharacterized protein
MINMIPNDEQCRKLWDKYRVPEDKRRHLELVGKVADTIGCKLLVVGCRLDAPLLKAAGLLHDIDKAEKQKTGEQHPDGAVRILKEAGFPEVADLVKNHALHMILDLQTKPATIEEKVLFLADKMVKYEIIGVDRRFQLWYDEKLPAEAMAVLDASYPIVKELENEIFNLAGITLKDLQV